MADKQQQQKSKKSGGGKQQQPQQPQQAQAQKAVDPEEAAKKKAEKERKRAEFEAQHGAKIAAEKAAKDKAKLEKKGQKGNPNQKTTVPSSTASSTVAAATTTTTKSEENTTNKNITVNTVSNKKSSNTDIIDKKIDKTIEVMKTLDINVDNKTNNNNNNNNNVKQSTATPSAKTPAKPRITTSLQSRVQTLFDHLPKGVEPKTLFEEGGGIKTKGIDTAFITLGLKYSHGQLQGSNNRVIALLNVIGQFIESYTTPPEKDFKYDFAQSLKTNLEFLRKCRPFAVAMNNTVDFINGKLSDIEIKGGKSEDVIKTDLARDLLEFREERIDKATEAIVAKAKTKIVNDDVVLIFGSSDLVREVIVAASEDKAKSFSLVVIDGRPYATERRAKGLDIISRLVQDGIIGTTVPHVKYTSITGLSNVIRSVTKVILGAHGLLANGGVLAHCGTSQIALMASANNIPVLVCCETLKFCDKSPTDSFFLNEIGTGFGLDKKFADCEPYLVTPVIKYDVTPPELVTAVITDVDILPCTSVPVVLRVQENRTIKLCNSGKTVSTK